MKIPQKLTALLLVAMLIFSGCASATPPVQEVPANAATREYALNLFAYTIGRNTLRTREPADLAQYSDNTALDADTRYNIALFLGCDLAADIDAPTAPKDTLRPKDTITRLEALLLFANCIFDLEETNRPSGFTDVPDYATARIDSLVAAGYLTVPEDGMLHGDDPATVEDIDGYAAVIDGLLTPVRLEDDFYTYVNRYAFRNKYANSDQEINAGAQKVTWSYFRDASINVLQFEQDMLDEILSSDGSAYAEGSRERKIYDLYTLYLDSDKVEAEPLRPFYEQIDACEDMDALYTLFVDMTKNDGILPLFYIGSAQIVDDEGVEQSYVDLLPNVFTLTGFIQDLGKTNDYLPAYKSAYETFMLACGVSQEELDATHDQELALETALAQGIDQQDNFFSQALIQAVWNKKNGLPLTDKGESAAELLANGMSGDAKAVLLSRSDDAELLGNFDLFRFLDDCSGSTVEQVHVDDLQFVENIGSCWQQENLAAWKLLFKKAIATVNMEYLDPDLSAASIDMAKSEIEIISGHTYDEWMTLLTEQQDGDAEAARTELEEIFSVTLSRTEITTESAREAIKNYLSDDIARLYVDRNYTPETKETIVKMIEDIRTEFEAHINALDWMSDATKQNAVEKLDSITLNVLYPDTDYTPKITTAEEGGSMLLYRMQRFALVIQSSFLEATNPALAHEAWRMSADTVNACYIPDANSINVPAGILLFPMYDEDATYYENLGAIGAILGHEITHGFDTNGSGYDKFGRKKNWWTDADRAYFDGLAQNVIDYYNKWEYLPGRIQDASKTVTEDIADLGGLSCVFGIMQKNGATDDEMRAAMERYAMMWAQLANDDTYICSASDVHSEHKVRVNAGLASLDLFYELYDIEEGDGMYVTPEDRVHIW